MPHAALRLVASEATDGDVLPFERRVHRRRNISGHVTSLQQPTDQTAFGNRISSLQLLDISDSGLGGVLQEAVEPGTPIVVFFPPHGAEIGFDRHGHVVRCTPSEHGFRIGIRLVIRSAA